MYKCLLLALTIVAATLHTQAQSNVGIGTNSPASKATVNGNMAIGSSYSNIPAPTDGAIIQGVVGIGTSSPNSSTILDISSSNKGVRFPNVNLLSASDVATVPSPPQGLVVWNTGVSWGTAGLYINTGTSGTPLWDKVNTGTGGTVTGVTASAPLSSSGGATPNITLSGTVPVTNGGTGVSTFGGTNTVLYTPSANTLSSIATANNGVLATNGSGAPSITSTLPTAVQGNITNTGTITSGTWNATRIGLAYGGTNTDLSGGAAVGDMLVANSTTSFSRVAAGASGQVLKSNGPGTLPTWQTDNAGTGTVTGTGAATQVAFWNNTSSLTGTNNLYWDNTNVRLGIGTNAPTEKLELSASPSVFLTGNSNAWGYKLNVNDYGGGNVPLRFIKRNAGTDSEVMRLTQNGYLGILNNNPSYPLDVTGSGRVSNNFYWGGAGTNGVEVGTGDGASYSTYNFALKGWYGMALMDYSNTVRGVYDFRTGNLTTDGVFNFRGTGNNLLAGKLGIGTTSPTYGLDLQGSSSTLQVKRPDGTPSVSGGTVSTSGGYTYVVFTSSGTFTPNGAANVEVLVIGGGGGGGGNGGGGGGAGGVVYNSSYAVGTSPITVTVGGGGYAGASTYQGGNGGNSVFGSITAYGGGGGASRDGGSAGQPGGSGGGGGGGGGGRNAAGGAVAGQGNGGGNGTTDIGCSSAGGGGGGAGSGGTSASTLTSGNGGAGIQYSQFAGLIPASPSGWFAAGGGGGPTCGGTTGTGGSGIGGTGGGAGAANTGSGGGGASGTGAAGVVIIRYPTSTVFTTASTLVAAANGYVGVGTNNPQVPLHVAGSSATNAATSSIRYINYGGGSSVNQNTAWSGPVTIYSEGDIMSRGSVISTSVNAFSDRRIKDVIGLSDNKKDLDLVNRIQVTKYKYIDSIGVGNKVHTKVIAQQVEEVYPEAVTYTTNYIPNVYTLAQSLKAENGKITITLNKAHDLNVPDKVKMIDEKGVEIIANVLQVNSSNSFTVASTETPVKLFVYGKQVTDFRAVDYEALSMLGISAIQELTQRITALEKENAALKANSKTQNDAKYNELKAQVDELMNLMQKNGIKKVKEEQAMPASSETAR